jgi:predicted Ser/Thr protein kinase
MTEPRFVIDSRRNRYELGRLLGEGGQGVVYEIKGGKLAAKLLRTTDPAESNRIENQINRLKSLDLSGIDIAQPEAVLVQAI